MVCAPGVVHVCRSDVHCERISVPVDSDMTLYTLDTLPSVYAGDRRWKPGADALAVYDRHGLEDSLSRPMPLHKDKGSQCLWQMAPRAPATVKVIYGLVWRISHRQPAPLASGIHYEEDGLKDIERVMP